MDKKKDQFPKQPQDNSSGAPEKFASVPVRDIIGQPLLDVVREQERKAQECLKKFEEELSEKLRHSEVPTPEKQIRPSLPEDH